MLSACGTSATSRSSPTSTTASRRLPTASSSSRARSTRRACEGALLVVDAAQGVEAQTLANTYLAVDAGLELVPILNKIDLASAEPERVSHEIGELLGDDPGEI